MQRKTAWLMWTLPSEKCVAAPDIEVKTMMNIEVATVIWIGKFIVRCSIGTMRAPPPKPKRPDERPPKKLNTKPVFTSVSYSKMAPPSSTILRCQIFPILGIWIRWTLNWKAMRKATKIRKTPKMSPKSLSSIKLVRYAPRNAPGMVVRARIKPTL